MKRFGLLLGFIACLMIIVPSMAQDKAKDGDKDKTEKSDTKDEPKKKEEPKKSPSLTKWLSEKAEKSFTTRIINMKPESNREFTIEVQERDNAKVQAVANWSAQREAQLAQELANINRIDPKDFKGRLNAQQNYQRNVAQYQIDLAKQNIYSPKNYEVRAADDAKVRTITLPIEFDDTGKIKKFTKKELHERKDKTGLPGYPSEFDAIKQGQVVDIYMVKQASSKKKDDTAKKKKKGPADDDPAPAFSKDRPMEYLLIVIKSDAK